MDVLSALCLPKTLHQTNRDCVLRNCEIFQLSHCPKETRTQLFSRFRVPVSITHIKTKTTYNNTTTCGEAICFQVIAINVADFEEHSYIHALRCECRTI